MTDKKNSLEQFKRELEEDIQNFDKKQSLSHATENISQKRTRTESSVNYSKSTSRHHTTHHQVPSSSKHSSHSKNLHSSHKKKKRKKWPRVLCSILVIAILLLAAGYGFLHWELNRIQRNSDNKITDTEVKENIDTKDEFGLGKADANLLNDPNITNILLIGQDRREGDKAEMRSDAMIICSINSKTSEISLTSLMRDMYLPIPGYGYGMLNSTYLIGGFDLLNKTIEKNFGIPITGNLEVDFERFVELMDIVGPIDLDLTTEESMYLNNMQGTTWAKQSGSQNAGGGLSAGTNSLNSKQVLLYCRMRQNVGGDWGRTDRQRKVITASFNKLKQSGAKSILSFVHQAMPLLTTNMTNTAIIKLAYAVASYKMDTTRSYRLPYEGTYTQEIRENALHVLVPDIKQNKSLIQDKIYNLK